MNNVNNILNRPFPEADSLKKSILGKFCIALFITLFLIFLEPFDLQVTRSNVHHLLILGLLTFLTSILFDFIVKKVFNVQYSGVEFTFKKWLVLSASLIVLLAIINCIYLVLLSENGYESLFKIVCYTFVIAIFPLSFIGSVQLMASEKKYSNEAKSINVKTKIPINNSQTIFNIRIDQIVFIETLQNYVQIAYFDNDNKLCIQTERCTLKKIEFMLSESYLVKCHRRYIINLSKIDLITGNSQGLVCKMKNTEHKILISRSFIPKFKNQMASYSSQN